MLHLITKGSEPTMLSGFEATGRAHRTRSSAQFPLALGTADQFPLAWIHGCFRLWGSVSPYTWERGQKEDASHKLNTGLKAHQNKLKHVKL